MREETFSLRVTYSVVRRHCFKSVHSSVGSIKLFPSIFPSRGAYSFLLFLNNFLHSTIVLLQE